MIADQFVGREVEAPLETPQSAALATHEWGCNVLQGLQA